MNDALIDWEALNHTEGEIPWPAIDAAIAAIVADPELWEALADVYTNSRLLEDPIGYVELYAPLILGEAASRLAPGEPREKILEFLLDSMVDAYDEEDEICLMQTLHACGRMGRWILPCVLRRLEDPDGDDRYVQDTWGLLDLVRHETDTSLRERVARLCIARLEEVADDRLDIDDLLEPVSTLAAMKWTGAREIMERLDHERHAEIDEEYGRDFQDNLAAIRAGPQASNTLPDLWWDNDLHDFLDGQREEWDSARANGDSEQEHEDDQPLDEKVDEDTDRPYDEANAKQRAAEWGAAFAASDEAKLLPASRHFDAADDATNLIDFGMAYFGMDIATWGVAGWEELLVTLCPRKFTADPEWFAGLAPFATELLRWLDSAGLVPGGKTIAAEVAQWGPEIVGRSNDPAYWGMSKSFMIQAMAEGVEPGNQEQLNAFVERYNARLADAENDAPPPHTMVPPATYIREQAKVGRNEPCPCGSGKKYKKCCAR